MDNSTLLHLLAMECKSQAPRRATGAAVSTVVQKGTLLSVWAESFEIKASRRSSRHGRSAS